MNDLIDTTEMYLRTIYDLTEEGIAPMRARIVERLSQSGPTVSQTVARMERDGLLFVCDDRSLKLSEKGKELAVQVTRKHRLAEVLLYKFLKLPWEDIHAEACRWEHVISEKVERKIYEVLGSPTQSPFGNEIPGLAEIIPNFSPIAFPQFKRLADLPINEISKIKIKVLHEHAQEDNKFLSILLTNQILPGTIFQAVFDGKKATLINEKVETIINGDFVNAIRVDIVE